MNSAIARARHQSTHGPRFPYGMCALDVRQLFDAPSSGDADQDGDADAVDVFMRAQHQHRVSAADLDNGYQFPRAVPVLFAGGSHGHGHAAVTTGFGKGWNSTLWSPDTDRAGFFDKVTIARVVGWMYHGAVLGWVEDLGGLRIYNPKGTN